MTWRGFVTLTATITLVGGLVFGALRVYEKAENLIQRFQKIEQSIYLMGKYIGHSLETYQNTIEAEKFIGAKQSPFMPSNGAWNMLGGQGVNKSWPENKFYRARSIAEYDNAIYVGLDGKKEGSAQVWRHDNTGWRQIGGDGISESWIDSNEVVSLQVYNEKLYAGLISEKNGATVWAFNGKIWELVGGDVSLSWNRTDFRGATAMTVSGEKLYVGLSVNPLRSDKVGPAIFAFDGQKWKRVVDKKDWTEGYWGIYELFTRSNGDIVIGTTGGAGAGDVWRLRDGRVRQIGGDGIAQSWINPGIDWVLRFVEHKGSSLPFLTEIRLCPAIFQRFGLITARCGHRSELGVQTQSYKSFIT